MLKQATYCDGTRAASVRLKRTDVLLKSEKEVLCFPRLIELDGDRLALVYLKKWHERGGEKTKHAAISEDFGRTWVDLGGDSPWSDRVTTSGILGYLPDGSITYIDCMPRQAQHWKVADGPYHQLPEMKLADPGFRIRRFAATGECTHTDTCRLAAMPWGKASYELYGSLLSMPDGSLIAAVMGNTEGAARVMDRFRLAVVRSTDGGRTFVHLHTFEPTDEEWMPGGVRFTEPDLAILANGDLLCVMRTSGNGTPLYQSRSSDGGRTWTTPVSTGWPQVKPVLRLLKNGVLVCASGRGFYGHPQVTHLLLSLDGRGERWEHPFAFHTGPGCAYTSTMERDGKLYVTYSDSDVATPFGGGGNCPVGTYGLPFQSIKRAVLHIEAHAADISDPPDEPPMQGGATPMPDTDGFNDSLRY